ncbi:putative cation diffusion facilitator family metal ion transporter [Venustampulla echinocandica]|uniref:Putative cation diffusion facilitator family metal ion transporter n=1 Tax=Venustampulla echinocandica TaxID=2656787 RepID=A0A370TYV9_9HELO|nr:putative cation diffusion facilitator family metal ion transporter [Venustampulla echinocandica]RDL40715.1 putative cation diffusion facilitator family metal ion transporter [Venustampulla echinocandica]
MPLSRQTRLSAVIGISCIFFIAEISVGFYTHSLALVADAFHYLNDLLGFVVALAALKVSAREHSPQALSFGWQRAQLLGAFFNGVFLVALGLSIFLQAIERFVSIQRVENPMLVLIIGCVGLGLNIVSATFLHEHDHGDHSPHAIPASDDSDETTEQSQIDNLAHPHYNHRHNSNPSKVKGHGHDLGMLSVLTHVIGDAINNIGVIIAAAVIWQAKYEGRFYADPAVSVGIAIMIMLTAIPIIKRTGSILLQSAPLGVSLDDVKHDLEQVKGVASVHELHAWRLSQNKAIATAHIVTSDDSLANFVAQAKMINECLHAYGIHSTTLQPELNPGPPTTADLPPTSSDGENGTNTGLGNKATGSDTVQDIGGQARSNLRQRVPKALSSCRITCGDFCEPLQCCK